MSQQKDANESVFMQNTFTVLSSFRHTPELERAIRKAMEEKRVSRSHIILGCLTGTENLNRYLDQFDEKDIRWCFDQRMKMMRERTSKAAAMEAMAEHERVNAAYAKKISRG